MADPRPVNAPGAPDAIGPYSHAIAHDGLLFCSGQIGLDPGTGSVAGEAQGEQAVQCLRNLAAVCEAAGTSLDRALRITIYATQLRGFDEINQAYAGFFEGSPPARVVVGTTDLPKQALVEIDAIVALER